ncbi:hypothetical protein H4R22_003182 [Coemansia sp. RSA 1290]|nr:hypothetical protein H4R22_003182 [Coemansia sp. RSA 1290]
MSTTKTFTLYRVNHEHDSNGEPINANSIEAFKEIVNVASNGEKPLCFRIGNVYYKDVEAVYTKIDEDSEIVVYNYPSIRATVKIIISEVSTEEFSEIFSNETISDLLSSSLPKVSEDYKEYIVSLGIEDYKSQLASSDSVDGDERPEPLSDERIKELVENITDNFLSIVFSPACYPRFKVEWSEERDGTNPLPVDELVVDHLEIGNPVVTIHLPKKPTASSTTIARLIIPY